MYTPKTGDQVCVDDCNSEGQPLVGYIEKVYPSGYVLLSGCDFDGFMMTDRTYLASEVRPTQLQELASQYDRPIARILAERRAFKKAGGWFGGTRCETLTHWLDLAL